MNKLFADLGKLAYTKVMVIGLIVGALFYFFVYDDGSAIDAQLVGVRQKLAQEEVKKKETENTLKQVREMQDTVGRLSTQYQEISKRLPPVLYSIDINKTIDGFARTSGVKIKSKKPASDIPGEVVEEVPIDVILEGSYTELAQFTYFVSTAEKMSRVKKIVITSDNETRPSKKLKFEGQVVGYRLAPEKVGKPQ